MFHKIMIVFTHILLYATFKIYIFVYYFITFYFMDKSLFRVVHPVTPKGSSATATLKPLTQKSDLSIK